MGSYLFQRILEEGKDSRFDEIKKSPTRFAVAFFAQATWVSLCLLPVIALNSVPAAAFAAFPAFKASDAIGLLVYISGFAFEITADRQKSKWLRERREKVHDEQFMTSGLWSVRYVETVHMRTTACRNLEGNAYVVTRKKKADKPLANTPTTLARFLSGLVLLPQPLVFSLHSPSSWPLVCQVVSLDH